MKTTAFGFFTEMLLAWALLQLCSCASTDKNPKAVGQILGQAVVDTPRRQLESVSELKMENQGVVFCGSVYPIETKEIVCAGMEISSLVGLEQIITMAKIDSSKIEYLALEGGGGKGVVYSGAIGALQGVFQSRLKDSLMQSQAITQGDQRFPLWPASASNIPLFPIWHSHPSTRPLKGIAGASAGAITAFFLAMGLSHAEIVAELNVVRTTTLANVPINASEFELFFEDPDPDKFREFTEVRTEQKISSDSNYRNKTLLDWYSTFLSLLTAADRVENFQQIPAWAAPLLSLIPKIKVLRLKLAEFLLSSMLNDSFLAKRLLLGDVVWPEGLDRKLTSTSNDPTLVSKIFWDVKFLKIEIDRLLFNDRVASGNLNKVTFGTYNKLARYVYCLTNDRGLFSGIAVRKYLARKLQTYIIDKAKAIHRQSWLGSVSFTAETMTFSQFFYTTGVDLVLTGTNILQNIPVYFSRTHTPDFPVIDAVGASMSIPGLFKPLKIKARVQKHLFKEDILNMKYYGMIVDGGMLNNYPINAFNGARIESDIMYHGAFESFVLQSPNPELEPFDGKVLGLRLQQLYRPGFETPANYTGNGPNPGGLQSETPEEEFIPYHAREFKKAIDLIDQPPDKSPFFDFLGQILETFAYPAENGQVRSQLAREHTLLLDTGRIGITDFSNPKLDKERGFDGTHAMKSVLVKNAAKTVINNVL